MNNYHVDSKSTSSPVGYQDRSNSPFIAVMLVIALCGFCDLFTFPARVLSDDNIEVRKAIFQILWAISYIGFFIAILLNKLRLHSKRLALVIGLSGYAVISLFWVTYQYPRFDLAFGFAATLMISAMVAETFPDGQVLKTLRLIVNILVFASLCAYALGWPGAVYSDGLDRMNLLGGSPMMGIFSHKNNCALISCLGFSLNIGAYDKLSKKIALLLMCATSVVLSGSATGLIIVSLIILLHSVVHLSIKFDPKLTRFFVIFCIAMTTVFAVFGLDVITTSLGRDAGLTGRSEIWRAAILMIEDKPILGWGYAGAFAQFGQGPFFDYYSSPYYTPVHMQNSFLQIAVELGLVGIVIFIIITVIAFYSVLFHLSHRNWRLNSTIIYCLTVVTVDAFAEHVFVGNSIALFIIGFAFCKKSDRIYSRDSDPVHLPIRDR